MAKNFLKFAWGFGALLILGLAIFYGIQYYQYRQNPQLQAQKQFEELERLYREDTYGGFTPEETLQLFIEALKTGDVELASRYFVLYKQDDWLETLQEYEKEGILLSFAEELENTKKIWKKSDKSDETTVSFTYLNVIKENKIVEFEDQKITVPAGNYTNESIFLKYPSGVWKIEGL